MLSLLKANLTKPRKRIILNCPTKPKGVTTQALDEYFEFLMVVFKLLLNGVHVLYKYYV